MIARLVIFAGLLLGSELRAGWNDLRDGVGAPEVTAAIGAPLIASVGRGGRFVVWTYDGGGYVIFARGKVLYWQRPRGPG